MDNFNDGPFAKVLYRPHLIGLKADEMMVFMYIAGWQRSGKDCYTTNSTFYELFGLSEYQIQTILKKLENAELITRQLTYGSGVETARILRVTSKGFDEIKRLADSNIEFFGLEPPPKKPGGDTPSTQKTTPPPPKKLGGLPPKNWEDSPQKTRSNKNNKNNKNSDKNRRTGERESGGARGTPGAETLNPDTLTIKQFKNLDDEAKNDFLNNIRDDCFGYDKRFAATDDIFTSRENKRFAAETQEDCLRTIGSSEEIFTQERKDALFDDIVEQILNRI